MIQMNDVRGRETGETARVLRGVVGALEFAEDGVNTAGVTDSVP